MEDESSHPTPLQTRTTHITCARRRKKAPSRGARAHPGTQPSAVAEPSKLSSRTTDHLAAPGATATSTRREGGRHVQRGARHKPGGRSADGQRGRGRPPCGVPHTRERARWAAAGAQTARWLTAAASPPLPPGKSPESAASTGQAHLESPDSQPQDPVRRPRKQRARAGRDVRAGASGAGPGVKPSGRGATRAAPESCAAPARA